MQNFLAALARLLVLPYFALDAYRKIADWKGARDLLNYHEVPQPDVALPVLVGATILGGVSLLLGLRARAGAVLLFLVTAAYAYYYHDFWTLHGPDAPLEQVQFCKNAALGGGLLMIAAFGPGAWSLDGRREGGL